MTSVAHVFNQYYFDLLRRLKTWSKQNKERSKPARDVLRAIKKHYASYDKLSAEHHAWFTGGAVAALRDTYAGAEDLGEWARTEGKSDAPFFRDVPMSTVTLALGDRPFTYHQYLTTLFSLCYPMTDDEVSALLHALKHHDGAPAAAGEGAAPAGDPMEAVTPAEVRRLWTRLAAKKDGLLQEFPDTFKEMEQTALGKLAKEIMQEVDIGKLQSSIGEDGDMLKAFSDPNGGMAQLLSTVSQKMMSKMASGEIKQETLLSDALQFASKLGGMGSVGGMDLSSMGNILKTMGSMQGMMGGDGDEDGDGGGFDMGALASMLGGAAGGPKGGRTKSAPNMAGMAQHARRAAMAKEMRRKLDKKRRANGDGEGGEGKPDDQA